MKICTTILAALAMLATASCQTTIGAGSISGGSAVGVSTTVGGGGASGDFLVQSMVVVPDPSVPGRFEVLQRAGRGPSEYWCAAGRYAIERLRVAPASRIYLENPMGPGKLGRGNSVGFTVQPDAALKAKADAQTNGLSMSIDRVGENWGAEHGRLQCKNEGFFFF